MTDTAKARQIPLDLRPAPDFTFESFIRAPSNADALALITAWPHWPAPGLLLIGPEGSGKTHLGQAWARKTGAVFIDDANAQSDDALFGLINQALRSDISGLLLASRRAPDQWDVALPDLRSRLGAMPSVLLQEPDDDSLRPITRALFERRGRVVPEDVIDYLLHYTDRSVPSLRAIIEVIDDRARETKADVTKRLAGKVLRQIWDADDQD